MTSKTKVCFKCDARKPVGRFYRHPKMADGRLNKCQTCTKRDVKKRNPEKLKAYYRERDNRPERLASERRRNAVRRQAEPGRTRARTILNNAIRAGKVRRQSCEVCAARVAVEGHHKDYRKPLDVEWLCRKCHRAEHRKTKSH